jgi:OOP family OmpA-OmpF porin
MQALNKKNLLAVSVALLGASGGAMAQGQPIIGYWVDSSNRIVRNTWGECWRTGSWSPSLAIAECEGGVTPKAAPVAAPAPAPAAAPAPAPVAAPAPAIAAPPAPPPAYKTVITDKPIRLEGANFATGSSKLLPGASAKLDEVVQAAKDHPEISFEVSGYTDNMGNAQANVRLSQARADAVKAYLVGKGVAASRIDTRGFGAQDPVADNRTAEGRAQNRRVEIRYTDKVETRVRVTQ